MKRVLLPLGVKNGNVFILQRCLFTKITVASNTQLEHNGTSTFILAVDPFFLIYHIF